MTFEIQILSDIHLELRKTPFNVTPTAPHLALLGDIGNPMSPTYREFLLDLSGRFEHIFIVAGNHEFYHNDYHQACDRIGEICHTQSNLHFLNRQKLTLHGFEILGATLWSRIDTPFSGEIFRRLNDFRLICYQGQPLSLENYQLLHEQDLKFLNTELCQPSARKKIVFTHHAPLDHTGNPQYHNSPLSSAFVNRLDDAYFENVALWGFGHTHWQVDFHRLPARTRIVARQTGYEHEHIFFDPSQGRIIPAL